MKYLSRIQLFNGLELEQLHHLEPHTPMNTVKRKTIIASPYMPQKRLFLVKSGKVRLYKLSKSGKELTVDLLGEGNIFGQVGSFTAGSQDLYAETIEDSVICTLETAQFEAIIKEYPELGLKFIEMTASRLKEVEEMLELMAYGSIRKRLLYLLYQLSQKFGRRTDPDQGWIQLEVKITHQELASMAGCIRETVSEQLSGFMSEGLISRKGVRSPMSVQPELLFMAMERA
ncbi:Crp/Fnr family transcriptional regulator [Paenibacillus sp. NEAU-GSW1]|uniref:Crp/Fnr family transcriptional regulator n=1 Tax=Paenibacillus sp. NEAU-GSW1 TaxID=2682486 RepID=UPI003464C431